MANNYGYIFTKDNVKEQLKNMNRTYQGRQTWGEYYGAIDIAKQDALSKITHDYSSDVLEAYKTAEENKSIVANSALGQGYKEEAFKDIDASLMQAYDAYRQTYADNVESVESNVDAQKAAIDKALDVEATNMQSMLNSGYDYLTDLYNRAYGLGDYDEIDNSLNSLFEDDALWNKYLTEEVDKEGNVTKRLLTQNELYSQLFDENNELTIKGTDFYDQMINQLGSELGEDYGYYSWLNKTNPDLFEWSQSYNPYDYNAAGTNMGTFKTMLNMQSTDSKYDFVERFGGMTRNEIDNKMNEFVNSINFSDPDAIVSNIDDVLNNIEKWSRDLGIYDDLDKELGGWDNVKNSLLKTFNDVYDKDELSDMYYEDVFVNTTDVLAENLLIGVGSGTLVAPGIGTVLGGITALASSVIYGGFKAKHNQKETAKENAKLISRAKRDYLNLITVMTNYAIQKQESAQRNHK